MCIPIYIWALGKRPPSMKLWRIGKLFEVITSLSPLHTSVSTALQFNAFVHQTSVASAIHCNATRWAPKVHNKCTFTFLHQRHSSNKLQLTLGWHLPTYHSQISKLHPNIAKNILKTAFFLKIVFFYCILHSCITWLISDIYRIMRF